jgi:hypothetical protein
MKLYIYIILSLLLSYSCNSDIRKIEQGVIIADGVSTIYLDPKVSKNINLSEIIKDINLIFLQTSDDSFLGEISKIERDDNCYFILNSFDKFVYVFDSVGNFKTKIGNKGNGPGELQFPECFALNKELKEVWLTNNFQSILKFDYDGNFKESQSIDLFFTDLYTSNNYIYFHTSKRANFDNQMNQICRNLWIETSENNTKTYFPYNPIFYPNGGMYFDTKIPFCRNGDSIIYSSVFNDTIYSIKNDTLNAKYAIDFNNDVSDKISNISGEDVLDYLRNNSTKACYLQNVLETSSFLRFNYVLNMELYDAFYDKKQKKLVEGKLLDNVLGAQPIFLYAYDNKFVGYVNAFDLKISEKTKHVLDDFFFNKLKGINLEEHNPILFEIELKSLE